MIRLASFFPLPRWLERAWQQTRIDPQDSLPPWVPHDEQQTMPLPLHGSLVDRR